MTHSTIIQDLFDLSGKVACVTGASAGLGRRAAIALASAGAKVVGVARRRDALLGLKQEIGEVFSVVDHDLANRDLLENLVHKVAQPYGAPDIIVHAAGINTRQLADDVTSQGWDMTLDLNLRKPFLYRNASCLQCGKKAGVGYQFRISTEFSRLSGRIGLWRFKRWRRSDDTGYGRSLVW
jgi:NAD(P)-dependent dehydrogenase (short-subunit alcohol dehydrogenase family)